LDVLAESGASRTRRALLERLPAFGREIGKRASARLTDNRWYVRRNMLKVIGDLDEAPEDIHAEEFMKDEDPRVRLEALRILLARPDIRENVMGFAIGDKDDHVAMTGLRAALSSCPEGAVPRIASVAVSDRSDDVRTLAVRVLGESRHKVALKALLQLTSPHRKLIRVRLPPKTPVYLAALKALHRFNDERARKTLAQAANSRDPEVAAAATATTVRDQ
jgi:HEAT repeat protein